MCCADELIPSKELPLVAQSRSAWNPWDVPGIRTDTGLLLAAGLASAVSGVRARGLA